MDFDFNYDFQGLELIFMLYLTSINQTHPLYTECKYMTVDLYYQTKFLLQSYNI